MSITFHGPAFNDKVYLLHRIYFKVGRSWLREPLAVQTSMSLGQGGGARAGIQTQNSKQSKIYIDFSTHKMSDFTCH